MKGQVHLRRNLPSVNKNCSDNKELNTLGMLGDICTPGAFFMGTASS